METGQKANREYLDDVRREIGLPLVEEPDNPQKAHEWLEKLEVCNRPPSQCLFGVYVQSNG